MMKVLIVVFSIILVLFIGVQIFAMRSQSGIETYPYEVVKTYDDFEIRNYEASLFTTVKLATNNYNEASGQGFSKLAAYIFGGNDRQEKIAMTSPVAMSLEDSMTVMFMVPRDLDKDKLPTPNSGDIDFKEMPAKTVAAIRFGGWANAKKIEKYKQKLVRALKEEGIEHTTNFYFLGYNPPYETINRRNEVIVELVN